MARRAKFTSVSILWLLLAGCGGGSNSGNTDDFQRGFFSNQSSESSKSSDSRSIDSNSPGGSEYYGYSVCLSKVEVLHSTLGAEPSQYQYEFACLYAKGASLSDVSKQLSAQATESLCPRSFTYTDRVSLGAALNIRLKARTPTGPSSIFNSKTAYEETLGGSPCAGGKQSYSKKVGNGAQPTWMDIETVP